MAPNHKQKMLKSIDLKSSGLEIGPLCWPILTRSEANIKYVDHVDRKGLIELYKNDPGVDIDLIPEVDYALEGKSLRSTISGGQHFDFILASHVMEHVPNLVGWLRDLESVLKSNGILSLAIPDKRFTFDIDRRVSVIGDAVGAYIDNYSRPSAGVVFDYASSFRSDIDAKKVWDGELYTDERARHKYTLKEAMTKSIESRTNYVDTHCFVFTPNSFFAILKGLISLGLINFRVDTFYDTMEGSYEFFVTLRRAPANTSQTDLLSTFPKLPRDSYERENLAKISSLEQKVAGLKASNTQLEGYVSSVLNSRSWKITSPLRTTSTMYKKLFKK